MKITFTKNVSVKDSMVFDDCYEPELAIDEDEKKKILNNAFVAYLLVDGKLAGETFGKSLKELDEDIEDCKDQPYDAIYCYSTTILPAFRGKGLAKILKAFWLGQTAGELIVGHSTSPEMKKINEFFGAVHDKKPHKNWYKTEREAWFYRLEYK